MLIATLPSADKRELVDRIFSHPLVSGARYNVGIRCPYNTRQALGTVKAIADKYQKRLWVDLKGRQLRIEKWADPTYGDIELNHEIEVETPARIVFRGGHGSNITHVQGNRLYVNPNPEQAVGAGQAVNVLGKGFKIKGSYLTERDREHIEVAKNLGVHDYMLSFVEGSQDIQDVRALDGDAKLVLKIESLPGLEFVARGYSTHRDCQLMAARDDLFINIGENKFDSIRALELLLEKDPQAICASHIFPSLDSVGHVGMTDISDLELVRRMGYRNFMFSDEISHRHFDEAINAWKYFVKNG